MAGLIGRIGEYEQGKEEWTQYCERLEYYFAANGVLEEAKKKSIFLTVIGSSSYKLLRSLISPQKPGDKTLEELITVLQRHHSPTPSEIVQRYRFNTHYRQQAETIATFVSELRSIAEFCNYGESLNDMLRDRLVCGINDSAIQRRLLAEDKLSFTKAMEISQGMEAATKNVQTLQSSSGVGEVQPGAVHKLYSQQ